MSRRRPAILVRVGRLSGLNDKDQKAERAVVHALDPAVTGRPTGEASRTPRDQQADSSCSAFAEVNTG